MKMASFVLANPEWQTGVNVEELPMKNHGKTDK
jgi:hypothetical protein